MHRHILSGLCRKGEAATLTNAFIGHQIDGDGTYTSGNTFVGVGGDLTSDANSRFNSAPNGSGGELRIYVGTAANDLIDTNTLMNGAVHGGAHHATVLRGERLVEELPDDPTVWRHLEGATTVGLGDENVPVR